MEDFKFCNFVYLSTFTPSGWAVKEVLRVSRNSQKGPSQRLQKPRSDTSVDVLNRVASVVGLQTGQLQLDARPVVGNPAVLHVVANLSQKVSHVQLDRYVLAAFDGRYDVLGVDWQLELEALEDGRDEALHYAQLQRLAHVAPRQPLLELYT